MFTLYEERTHTTPRRQTAQGAHYHRPRRRPDVDRLEERTLLASSSFNLSSLITTTNPGVAGYVFNGTVASNAGMDAMPAVPIGDVNGAIDANGNPIVDYAFGQPDASPLGRSFAGITYVVFGGPSHLAHLDAADGTTDGVIQLNNLLKPGYGGVDGFVVYGTASSDLGASVAGVGNVLGHTDHCNDFLVSAYAANGNQLSSGVVYLIKGRTSWPAVLDTQSFNQSQGYEIKGDNNMGYLGDVSGAGDVNGDGIPDFMVADTGRWTTKLGEAFLIFGGLSNLEALDAADGKADGIIDPARVNGTTGYVFTGTTIDIPVLDSIGNFNGDSYSDLLLTDNLASPGGITNAGAAYVIFGGIANLQALDKLDGKQDGKILLSNLDGIHGFTIAGHNPGDALGIFCQSGRGGRMVGDFNGDGLDDVIVSEPGVSPNGISGAGEAFVVFGSTQKFPAILDVSSLNGTNGFSITGANANDRLGSDTDFAGDVNGDGVDDLLLGTWSASPNGLSKAGAAYVIYGHTGSFPAVMSVSSLNGTNGYVMDGINAGDHAGNMVAGLGDVNGDGYSDMLISAVYASPNGLSKSGQFYLVYGGPNGPGTAAAVTASVSQAGILAPIPSPVAASSSVFDKAIEALLPTTAADSTLDGFVPDFLRLHRRRSW